MGQIPQDRNFGQIVDFFLKSRKKSIQVQLWQYKHTGALF